jgi:hypothetical protein
MLSISFLKLGYLECWANKEGIAATSNSKVKQTNLGILLYSFRSSTAGCLRLSWRIWDKNFAFKAIDLWVYTTANNGYKRNGKITIASLLSKKYSKNFPFNTNFVE